jgi:hypothetical protein
VRDDACFTPESAAPVALTEVVSLYSVRFGLCLYEQLWRNQFCVCFPMISEKYAYLHPLQTIEHLI